MAVASIGTMNVMPQALQPLLRLVPVLPNCYQVKGYSLGLSTVFKIGAITYAFTTDAKEIPGCKQAEAKRMGGLVALQSDDGNRFVFGAAALGLQDEMAYVASEEGQAQAKLFDVKRPVVSQPHALLQML